MIRVSNIVKYHGDLRILDGAAVSAADYIDLLAARADLQKVVTKQFAALQTLPDFALIFAPPARQELLLCRRLLAGTLAHATALLGAAGKDVLGSLATWVDAAPQSAGLVPFNLAPSPPRSTRWPSDRNRPRASDPSHRGGPPTSARNCARTSRTSGRTSARHLRRSPTRRRTAASSSTAGAARTGPASSAR